MKAKIIKDVQNTRMHSRIGETVEIIRLGSSNRYWVKTKEGREISYPRNYLEVIPNVVDEWVNDILEAERKGAGNE